MPAFSPRPWLFAAISLLGSVAGAADTTLNVKSSYDVGEPIEISVTAPEGTKVEWAFSPGLITKPASADGLKHWAWAKPGKHTVTATVAAIVKTKKITVFVPDPKFPSDVTKAKLDTLEIFEAYIPAAVMTDEFTQKGGTEPDPTDPPPDTPPPPDKPPPLPVPKGAKQVILMYEESLPAPLSIKDPAVEAWLHTNVPGSWYRWDDDYLAASFAKYPQATADLYLFGKGARPDNEPTVVVEFKDGQRKSYEMPESPAGLLKLLEGFGPVLKATAAVFVFEKDDTAVPSAVRAALNTLNKAGIFATEFEDDTVDGTGDTPEQYKVPLAAARTAGLPALVVLAGNDVLRTVKNPKTMAEVTEAVKP